MAALCHDMGHLPFSHAAEKELLPDEWDHERLTREIILSEEMGRIWERMTPPLRALDVVKLAVGPRKAKDITFSIWETILSEIIVGDAFGVDRMPVPATAGPSRPARGRSSGAARVGGWSTCPRPT
jgi:HD superfamily phosphohydrolase